MLAIVHCYLHPKLSLPVAKSKGCNLRLHLKLKAIIIFALYAVALRFALLAFSLITSIIKPSI